MSIISLKNLAVLIMDERTINEQDTTPVPDEKRTGGQTESGSKDGDHLPVVGELSEKIENLEELGLDMSEGRDMIGELRGAAESGDADRIERLKKGIEDEIEKSKGDRAKKFVKQQVLSIHKKYSGLRREGISSERGPKMFKDLSELLGQRRYFEALQLIRELDGALDESGEAHYSKMASEQVAGLEKLMAEGKGLDLDVSEVKTQVIWAVKLFNEGEYHKALELAEEIRGNYENRKKEVFKERATSSLAETDRLLEKGRELGILTDELENRRSKLEADMEAADFISAYNSAEEINAELGAAYREKMLVIINRMKENSDAKFGEARQLGLEVEDEQNRISRSKELLQEGELERTKELFEVTIAGLDGKIADKLKELNREKLDRMEGLLEELADRTGIEHDGLMSKMSSAQQAFETGDYSSVDPLFEDFIKERDELLKEHVLQEYRDKVSEMEGDMVELGSLGIDMGPLSGKLDGVKSMIDSADMEGLEESFSEASREMEQVKGKRLKKVTKQHFTNAKRLLGELRELDVPQEEHEGEEGIFRSAIDAIKSKDFIKGCKLAMQTESMIEERIDRHFMELGRERIDEVSDLINKARGLEMGVAELVRGAEKAKEVFGEERHKIAYEEASAVAGGLRQAINKELSALLDREKQAITGLMEKADELGLDTEEWRDELIKGEEMAGEGRYDEAMETVKEAAKGLTDAIETRKWVLKEDEFDEHEGELRELAEAMGEEPEGLRSTLERMRKAVEERNVGAFDEYVEEFEGLKEEFKEELRLKELKNEFDGRADELERIGEAGIDTGDIRTAIERGFEAVSSGDPESATEIMGTVNELIADAKNVRGKKIVTDDLREVKATFVDLRDKGIALDEEEEVFREILGLVKDEDYIEAALRVKGLNDRIAEKDRAYREERARTAMEAARERLEEIGAAGLEAGETEALITTAEERFQAENFEESEEISLRAREMAEGMLEQHRKEKTEELLKEVAVELEEGDELGIEMEPFRDMLEESNTLLAGGSFEEAARSAHNIRERFQDEKKRILKERVTETFENTRRYMEEAEELGLDIFSERTLLNYARTNIDDGDYESAGEFLDQARSSVEDLIKRNEEMRLCKEFLEKKGEIEEQFNELEGFGMDLEEPRELLSLALESAREKNIGDLESYQSRLEEAIENEKRTQGKELAKSHIGETKRLFREVAAQGASTAEEENILREVAGSVKTGDFIRAIRLAQEVDTSLLKKQEPFMKKVFENLMEVRSLVEESEAEGVEVDALRPLLAESQGMFDQGEYSRAVKRIAELKEAHREHRRRYYKESTERLLNVIGDLLLESEVEDTSLIDGNLALAKTQYEQGSYEEAFGTAEVTRKKLLEAREKNLSRIVDEKVGRVQSLLADGEGLGIDVSRGKAELERAKDMRGKGALEEALELTDEIYEELIREMNELSAEDYQSGKEKTSSLLARAEDMGVDLGDIREDISLFDELGNESRFYEGKLKGEGISARLKKKIQQHSQRTERERLNEYRADLAELEKNVEGVLEVYATDLDLKALKDVLTQGEKALSSGDTAEAERLLDVYRERFEEHERALAEEVYPEILSRLEEDVRKIERIGISIPLAEELLESAREHVSDGNFDPVKGLQKHIEEIVEEAKRVPAKNVAKKKIASLRALFRSLKKKGMDLTREKEMFNTVLNAIKEKDFVRAVTLMQDIEGGLSDKKEENLEQETDSLLSEIDGMLREGGERGLDMRAVRRNTLNAKNLRKRGRYEKAFSVAEKAHSLASGIIGSALKQNALEELDEVRASLTELEDMAKSVGEGVEGIRNGVKEAEENAEAENYGECLERLRTVKEQLGEAKEEYISKTASRFLDLSEQLISERGEDVDQDTRVRLEVARLKLEENASSEARNTSLKLLNDLLSRDLDELRNLADEIVKREYFDEDTKNEWNGRVIELGDQIEEAEFVSAVQILGEHREKMGAIRDRMKREDRYLSHLKEAESLIEQVPEDAVAVRNEAQERMGVAVEKREGDLAEAIALLEGVVEDLGGAVGKLVSQRASSQLEELESTFREERDGLGEALANEMSDIISDIDGGLVEARTVFQEGDVEACIEIISSAEDKLDQLKQEKPKKTIEILLTKAKGSLEENRELGLDIFNTEAYIFKAMTSFDEGDLEGAERSARKALDNALEQRENVERAKIRETLKDVEMILIEGGELDLDMDKIETKIPEAEKYLEDGALREARELAVELHEEGREMIRQTRQEMVEFKYQEIMVDIEEAKEDGIDTDDIEGELPRIEEAKNEENFDGAMGMIAELRKSLEERILAKRKGDAKQELDQAFREYNEFKERTGRENEDLEAILDNAVEASNEDGPETMLENIREFSRMKEEFEDSLTREELESRLSRIEDELSGYGELGIDIAHGQGLLEVAGEHLAVKDFEEVEARISEAEELLREILPDRMKEKAEEKIREINELFDRLTEGGIESEERSERFSEILNAMDESDYTGAFVMARDLKEDMAGLLESGRREKLAGELEEAEEFYQLVRTKPYFSGRYKKLLKNALGDLNELYSRAELDEMERKFTIVKKTMGDLKKQMKVRDEIQNMLDTATKYKETAKELAADIDEELDQYKKVRSLIEKDDLKKGVPLLKKTIRALKKSINERRQTIAKMVLEEALFAFNQKKGRLKDEVTGELEELLKETTTNFKKGRFEASIKLSTKLKKKVAAAKVEKAPETPEPVREEPKEEPKGEEKKKEEPKPPAGPKKVRVSCPGCGKPYAASIVRVPSVATCPYCGEKAVVRNI